MRPRVLTLALMLVLGGCVSSASPASPASPASSPAGSGGAGSSLGPPALGFDWGRASSVERPPNYVESVPPDYPGMHPILRIAGQATMADVVAIPGGGFAAVGYAPPSWVPEAWTSADGSTWSIHPMGTAEFTFPVAVVRGAGGTIVAVGRSGGRPVAWTSTDGIGWDRHDVPTLGDGSVAERMTSIVAMTDGFLAGGSAGPELLDRHARFWTSADGRTWTPVADDPAAFAEAEVRSIAVLDGRFVAVGVGGTAQHPERAVAWTSPDGEHWTRIDAPAFADGIAGSVIVAPFGGLVAVGSDLDRRNAVAWTSADGTTWTRAPDEGSRQHPGGYAWMTDVVAIGDRLIAIGTFQGLQRGTGTSWVSLDGLAWEKARTAPVQEQGEFYAIAPGGPGAIVVGAFGAPDSYVPTVWLTPAR